MMQSIDDMRLHMTMATSIVNASLKIRMM